MSENFEFNLKEGTLEKMIKLKKQMGYEGKNWDEWFEYIISQNMTTKSELENALERVHYNNNFEDWVRSFALNLEDIWNGKSARDLEPVIEEESPLPNILGAIMKCLSVEIALFSPSK